MKLNKTIPVALIALGFALVSCGEKKTSTGTPDKKDPHAGHNHPPGQHGKTDNKNDAPADPHAGHDHGDGAHDHDGHDHGDHSHSHAPKKAGPHGGRILTEVEPHAEFFVTKDRKVRITFLDAKDKPIAVGTQSVHVVCGNRMNPTQLNFVKEADGMSLLSDSTLPSGMNFPAIVNFKMSADAKPAIARFSLNLADCSSCEYKEYACTCEHAH